GRRRPGLLGRQCENARASRAGTAARAARRHIDIRLVRAAKRPDRCGDCSMLTEAELRQRLAGAASAAPDALDVSDGALALGRSRVARRQRAKAFASSVAFVAVATVAATVLVSAGGSGDRAEAAVICSADR